MKGVPVEEGEKGAPVFRHCAVQLEAGVALSLSNAVVQDLERLGPPLGLNAVCYGCIERIEVLAATRALAGARSLDEKPLEQTLVCGADARGIVGREPTSPEAAYQGVLIPCARSGLQEERGLLQARASPPDLRRGCCAERRGEARYASPRPSAGERGNPGGALTKRDDAEYGALLGCQPLLVEG
ncbi:MAG TPA: hypothetical protein VL242_39535 [Sorangium sp.]|nr:hypothetical protein [Sorangium sp.]